jgi:hypothetical protein
MEQHMTITNKFNLPDTFLSFARNGKYDKGASDISVTTLIDSPRINLLKQQHVGEIESDVSDMIWPLLGTAVHHMLESSDAKGNVTMEERLFVDLNGWVLSGQIDHQEEIDGKIHISDYKVTSVWSVIYGKSDWFRQLNAYAQMVRMAKGREIGSIRIIAIMRDWNRRDAMTKLDYPQSPVAVVDIELLPEEKAMEYLVDRIHIHQEAQMIWDTREALVNCNDEERWMKPTTYALTKKGNKRATKVFDNAVEANLALVNMGGGAGYEVITRQGEYTRCEQYCSVSEFCTQWAMEKVGKVLTDDI